MLGSVRAWNEIKRHSRYKIFVFMICSFCMPAYYLQAEETTVSSNPLSTQIVVIDPGHGGKDSGIDNQGNSSEKNYVLTIAIAVSEALKNQPNIKVILTRDRDQAISVLERTTLSNQKDADLFISLHLAGETISGEQKIIVYINHKVDAHSIPELAQLKINTNSQVLPWDLAQNGQNKQSLRLAQIMQKTWAEDLADKWKEQRPFVAPIAVLVGVRAPAVLLELPTPKALDPKSPVSQAEINKTAQRLARGIIRYFADR